MEQLELDLEIPIEIKYREEKKVIKRTYSYVSLNKEEFELYDLYRVLEEIDCNSDIIVTNKKMAKVLLDLRILNSVGSKRYYSGASKGPMFDKIYKQIYNKIHYDIIDEEEEK